MRRPPLQVAGPSQSPQDGDLCGTAFLEGGDLYGTAIPEGRRPLGAAIGIGRLGGDCIGIVITGGESLRHGDLCSLGCLRLCGDKSSATEARPPRAGPSRALHKRPLLPFSPALTAPLLSAHHRLPAHPRPSVHRPSAHHPSSVPPPSTRRVVAQANLDGRPSRSRAGTWALQSVRLHRVSPADPSKPPTSGDPECMTRRCVGAPGQASPSLHVKIDS